MIAAFLYWYCTLIYEIRDKTWPDEKRKRVDEFVNLRITIRIIAIDNDVDGLTIVYAT